MIYDGDDIFLGEAGLDNHDSGFGSDILSGGPTDDSLVDPNGISGNDVLDSGPSDDTAINPIDGVVGKDSMNGFTGFDPYSNTDPVVNCES